MSASPKATSPKSADTKGEHKHQIGGSESQMGRGRGRPPEQVPEHHAAAIIDWISLGKTLREWCRNNNIHYSTIYLWMAKDKDFAQRFAHARDIGHDAIAEETMEIIDTFPMEVMGDGSSRLDSGHVAWMKNRVEQRMKLLAKWNPKKYGDKVGVEHSGGLNLTVATGVPDSE